MINYPKCHINDHPRPMLTRPHFMLLDGIWDFRFDDLDVGIKDRWYKRWEKEMDIIVPFSFQTKMSGIHDQTYHPIVWYQKKVWIEHKETTLIHFEKSDYETDLWVNGIHIGHEVGGYHRLTFDVSHVLIQGENEIVVRVKDTWDTEQPRGKQRWKSENFGCWYVETTGLYQSVWLEFLNQSYVKHVLIKPMNEDIMLDVSYEIEGFKEGLSLWMYVSFNGKEIVHVSETLKNSFGHFRVSMRTEEDQFKLMTWNEHHPHLYDIVFQVRDENMLLDEAKSYVGMRSWKSKDRTLYLNDEPVYLKMLLDQGYWRESGLTAPSVDALLKDIELTKKMGFNGIRKHQKIEDERFYYLTDILGVYVWLEMPSAYEFSPRMMEKMTKEWLSILRQYGHYTSIMTYVIFNESWGIPHVKNQQLQQQFSLSLYHLTKGYDDSRFVISNDGWEHTTSDIITIHNYVSEGHELKVMYEDVLGLMNQSIVNKTRVRDIFASGFKDEGQPILFSEYGGVAFTQDEGWGYGAKVESKKDFYHRLKGLTKALMDHPLFSGYCLTQTTDVEQEVNGVLTPEREPKLSFEEYKEINGVKL